jgi:hypothetical protein
MKAKLIVVLGCLLINSFSYACGGNECCQTDSCSPSINKCLCSDPNYDSNPCLTVSQYCEAYGNIGGLDAYP